MKGAASMLDRFAQRFSESLAQVNRVRSAGLYHYGRLVTSASDAVLIVEGREAINFISNNYLGMSVHPKVVEAMRDAARVYGTGMCGSPLACGTTDVHRRLEARLAAWFGLEAAMIFPSGYQALLGSVSGLVGPGDLVIVDALSHRSIIDGAKLSGATLRSFAHNDMEDLAEILTHTRDVQHRLIVVDSVYSMEGDIADLPGLHRLASEHHAALLIDEAHALGVIGEHGGGLMEHFRMPKSADVVAGTFSKFGGTIGGFVVSGHDVIDHLRHHASPYIFSASLPPPLCAGVLAAFEVFELEPQWHKALIDNTQYLIGALKEAGFNLGVTSTPVVPIFVGDPERTLRFNHAAFQRGVFASPVLAPLVPPRKSLLRLGVMARHTHQHLERAVDALVAAGREAGVLRRGRGP
jgi:8-amino-7-oxononanoate synthase